MTALWSNAIERLSSKIAAQNFEMWLRPIECTGISGQTITLRAPNQYVRLWFESNYLTVVLDELRGDSPLDYTVEFEVDAEADTNVEAIAPLTASVRGSGSQPAMSAMAAGSSPTATHGVAPLEAAPGRQRAASPILATHGSMGAGGTASGTAGGTMATSASVITAPTTARDIPAPTSSPLNPRYTFDTFVGGPSNQLAFAACQAVASTYPPKYNPVFICGGVGLGKTHLLHSVGHTIQQSRPGSRVMYLSGERFMNEYIHAIRTNHMHDFRRRYREGCDVLLVDDVQFLAGKDGTQDEFFHTFNALHDSHRQIVLTADRKPFEISDIADRLRSRFAWGLLADIDPPDLEMRVAILRQKAMVENIRLPDDVALYIAGAVKRNVRELEGALIRLAAYASLSHRNIDLAFAQQTLEGSITRPREHLTAETVIKTVAGYYGLKVADIKSARRHKSIAGPRAVAMYLARTHTKDSYPDLGRGFGGKHHTTVISAVEKTTRRLKDDAALRGEVHAIESLLLR